MKDYSRAPSPETRITLVRDDGLTIPHDALWRRIEARQRKKKRRHWSVQFLVCMLIFVAVQFALMGLENLIGLIRMGLL